jgi:chromate transporter
VAEPARPATAATATAATAATATATTATATTATAATAATAESTVSLRTLAGLFLRLGTTAFGGPAAHIAMMRREVVDERRWLTDQQFLDLVAAVNLVPGPNSTELAIHVGWHQRRFTGLVVAGLSFIIPAAVLSGLLGWVYVRWGTVPEATWLLYGVKPVIFAVVIQAIWSLLPRAVASARLGVIAIGATVAVVLGVHELIVLVAAGLGAAVFRRGFRPSTGPGAALVAMTGGGGELSSSSTIAGAPGATAVAGAAGVAAAAAAVTLPGLFWVFLKIGSVLFGSGYVLLAFLRADLIERLGWLSEAQLVDAVAVGQVTPGPVFSTATFIGMVLAGPAGAVVATVGIFLPAFVFVALSGPLVPRLRTSPTASAFLDGVSGASLSLMAVVTVALGRAAVTDPVTAVLLVGAALLIVRYRVGSTKLVVAGAALGFIAHISGVAS